MEASSEADTSGFGVDHLPTEVLEYILSLLSPYNDYKNAMLVSRRWYSVMKDVARQEYQHFHDAVADGTLRWTLLPPAVGPTIAERYSHSSCYMNKCLYVFGGCTSKNTTFNDLWKLDLAKSEWIRPLAMGSYPSPKAYASLVAYKNKLVLFGGWSHPTPLSLHQSPKFFQQLHTYSPESNSWEEITTFQSPPGLAGHGASVINDIMIIFGGSKLNGVGCNDVWVFDFKESEWTQKDVAGDKPMPRYGHAQVVIDDWHILIVGGCGGANMQFSDVWLLVLGEDEWKWEEIVVLQKENCAPQLWCHPACKVGDKLMVLSKTLRKPSDTSNLSHRHSKNTVVRAKVKPQATGTSRTTDHCCCCQEASPSKRIDNYFCGAKKTCPEVGGSQESSSDNDESNTCQHPRFSARTSKTSASRQIAGDNDNGVCSSSNASTDAPSNFTLSLDSQRAGSFVAPTPPIGLDASRNQSPASPSDGPSGSQPVSTKHHPGGRLGLPSIRPNAMRNRQKQLEMLKRHEERIKGHRPKEPKVTSPPSCCHGAGGPCKVLYPSGQKSQNPVYVHTLDLSDLLEKRAVTWLTLSDYGIQNAPEETIFYSLAEGRGELIMFGGIQTDMNNMRRQSQHWDVFSNGVHFLSSRRVLR